MKWCALLLLCALWHTRTAAFDDWPNWDTEPESEGEPDGDGFDWTSIWGGSSGSSGYSGGGGSRYKKKRPSLVLKHAHVHKHLGAHVHKVVPARGKMYKKKSRYSGYDTYAKSKKYSGGRGRDRERGRGRDRDRDRDQGYDDGYDGGHDEGYGDRREKGYGMKKGYAYGYGKDKDECPEGQSKTCVLNCGTGHFPVKKVGRNGCYSICRCELCPNPLSTCTCNDNEYRQFYMQNDCRRCRCIPCPVNECDPPDCFPGQTPKITRDPVTNCRRCECDGTRCDEPCTETCTGGTVLLATKDADGCSVECKCMCVAPNSCDATCDTVRFFIKPGQRCASCNCDRSNDCKAECNLTCTPGSQYLVKEFDETNNCYTRCECVACPDDELCRTRMCPTNQVLVEFLDANKCVRCRCAPTPPNTCTNVQCTDVCGPNGGTRNTHNGCSACLCFVNGGGRKRYKKKNYYW